MKIIAKVKLQPTADQYKFLLATIEQGNALCNDISKQAWTTRTFRRFDLQHLVYHQLRTQTSLSSQFIIHCVAKVADSYYKDRNALHTFKSHGAIVYDDRILTWYTVKQTVNIWSVAGRLKMPYQTGARQLELLEHRQGESDLVYSKQKDSFYLLAVCDLPDPDEQQVNDFLGVDFGETNIAVTSDGEITTSAIIEKNRQRQQGLRTELQAKTTKAAKRKLRKIAGRQKRFQRDINHQISKQLVAIAAHTQRGIALEDLTGISTRTRVKGKARRAKRSNWSFAQLRAFITYKAKMLGVPIKIVDPAYTSQRCFVCGHTERANRKTQDQFVCCACGHTAHADVNAARNIAQGCYQSP